MVFSLELQAAMQIWAPRSILPCWVINFDWYIPYENIIQ